MEERGCLGCGCGCLVTFILATILLLLVVCGLAVWIFANFANGQYQLELGARLLTVLIPVI